jgi:quercetin dioxygenase-like cupin family protein
VAGPPPFGAFVCVMARLVRMGLEGEAAQVPHAGDSFCEPPGVMHAPSENASDAEPASPLAVFVVPEGHESAVAA